MQAALKSFEGKNGEVQAMIVQDINEDGLIKEGVNMRFPGILPDPSGSAI